MRLRPAGLFMVALAYAFVALSPLVYYAMISGKDYVDATLLPAFAPWRIYTSYRVAYFGCAALASVLLCARSRFAVWPAVGVLVWAGASDVLHVLRRGVAAGSAVTEAMLVVGFALLAWYVNRLRRRNILR